MKPLVYFCRWQGAKLRLRGRDDSAVWGELVYVEEDGERSRPFTFQLATSQMTLDDGAEQFILDEMGVAVDPPDADA